MTSSEKNAAMASLTLCSPLYSDSWSTMIAMATLLDSNVYLYCFSTPIIITLNTWEFTIQNRVALRLVKKWDTSFVIFSLILICTHPRLFRLFRRLFPCFIPLFSFVLLSAFVITFEITRFKKRSGHCQILFVLYSILLSPEYPHHENLTSNANSTPASAPLHSDTDTSSSSGRTLGPPHGLCCGGSGRRPSGCLRHCSGF